MEVNARFGGSGRFFQKGRLKVPTGDTVDTILALLLGSAHLSALAAGSQ